MPEDNVTCTVAAHEHLGERLRLLRVDGPELDFAAGQFTKIGLPQDGDKPLMRAYSFVNSPAERPYQFYYDVIDTGNLTLRLDGLAAGDELLMSTRPNGLLVLRELPPAQRLFLLATGTGVGPFLSILKTGEPWERFRHIVLAYGVREAADLAFQDLIQGFHDRGPARFTFLPLVTRDDPPAGARRARVTSLLADGTLDQVTGAGLGEDCQFMLCGNPAMIRDMSDALKERGFERNRRARPGNVTIEKYW